MNWMTLRAYLTLPWMKSLLLLLELSWTELIGRSYRSLHTICRALWPWSVLIAELNWTTHRTSVLVVWPVQFLRPLWCYSLLIWSIQYCYITEPWLVPTWYWPMLLWIRNGQSWWTTKIFGGSHHIRAMKTEAETTEQAGNSAANTIVITGGPSRRKETVALKTTNMATWSTRLVMCCKTDVLISHIYSFIAYSIWSGPASTFNHRLLR